MIVNVEVRGNAEFGESFPRPRLKPAKTDVLVFACSIRMMAMHPQNACCRRTSAVTLLRGRPSSDFMMLVLPSFYAPTLPRPSDLRK